MTPLRASTCLTGGLCGVGVAVRLFCLVLVWWLWWWSDLKRMYHLFCRVPSTLEELRHALSEYVKNTGRELVADQERVKVRQPDRQTDSRDAGSSTAQHSAFA